MNNNKILGWTIAGIVSLGGIAACGSDDDKSPSTTKAPVSSTAITATGDSVATGDSTAVTTGGETNAAADKFCADVQSLVDKGPTDPDYTANLTKLTTDAQALITSNPAAAAKIQACLTDLVPGG